MINLILSVIYFFVFTYLAIFTVGIILNYILPIFDYCQDFVKKHIPEEKIVTLTGTVEERLEQISKYL
jgi:hypothetical protein